MQETGPVQSLESHNGNHSVKLNAECYSQGKTSPSASAPCGFGMLIWRCHWSQGTTGCTAVPAHPLWSQLLAEPRLPAWVTWAGWPRPGDVEEDVVRLSQMSPSDLCSFSVPRGKVELSSPQNLISISPFLTTLHSWPTSWGEWDLVFHVDSTLQNPLFLKTKGFDGPTGKTTFWKPEVIPLLCWFRFLVSLHFLPPSGYAWFLAGPHEPATVGASRNPCSQWLDQGSP